jgi:hypothetical protein
MIMNLKLEKMKKRATMKKIILISVLALPVIFFLVSFAPMSPPYPSGAPAGYTGSPGDGNDCSSCHGGSPTTVSGWISSDIPAEGYTPGTTYTITATATGTGNKGFEVSPQNSSGTLLGTLTAGSNNHLTGSGKYVTHNAAVSGSTATWTFTWAAPASGTGSVTFYGAFAITTSTTKLSTLVVSENTAVPLSVTATATPSTICAGDSSHLQATASGGNGTYAYSWTSVPPGFNSTQQNPWVKPSVNTQYNVTVTSGTSTANGSTNVTVNNPPEANAGANQSVCSDVTQVAYSGTASNYASVHWTTSGDGTFSNANALSGNYFPGTGDIAAGSATLTLTAQPNSPCATAATSQMTITLNSAPTAFAGNDTTACNDAVQIPVSGTAANYSAVLWTTSGDGSFSNPSALSGIYTFGAGDKTAGSVNLTLTASPQPPCAASVSSTLHVGFDPCTGISDPGAAQSFSIIPNPNHGQFRIVTDGSKAVTVNVFDVTGKQVFAEKFSQPGNEIRIDLTSRPKGVYYVQVSSEGKRMINKIIIL